MVKMFTISVVKITDSILQISQADFFYIATICAVTFFRCRIHICAFIFKYASALGFHVLHFLLFFFFVGRSKISRCFLFSRFCNMGLKFCFVLFRLQWNNVAQTFYYIIVFCVVFALGVLAFRFVFVYG